MPNRILRDGFVDSEAVAGLTDFAHRVYSNLLVKCDDAGRFDGRLEFIRSHLFPLGTARRSEDLEKALSELESAKLIIRYTVVSKPLIQITKWQRCGSAEKSKFPWVDGSHKIAYLKRETRDGSKDFVTSSISEGISTGCVPPTDGVRGELNTETETETETETVAKSVRGEDWKAILADLRQKVNPETGTLSNLPDWADDEFRVLWCEWLLSRPSDRPIGAMGRKLQLADLAKKTRDEAKADLRFTISNGYLGVTSKTKSNGRRETENGVEEQLGKRRT